MTVDETDPTTPPEAGEAGGADADPPVEVEVDTSELPADPVAELEARLAAAEQEKQDNWDKYLRAVADLDNYRKRAKRDLDDARADARTRVLKEILPVVDNLERALAHEGSDQTAVTEGVRLVLRQFLTALERCEVTKVEADGQVFDPNVHEAIGQEESDAPAGTVVNVLQTGYRLGERLLRPALVVVAKPRSSPPPESA